MICYRNLSNLTMTIFSQRRIASSKATTLSTTNMRWHCNVPFLPFRRINESQFSTLVLVEDSWFTVPWMPAKKLIGQSTFTQLRRILIQFNPSNGGYRKTSGRTMFRLLKQTWSYGSPASKRTFSCRSYWVDLVITSWVLSVFLGLNDTYKRAQSAYRKDTQRYVHLSVRPVFTESWRNKTRRSIMWLNFTIFTDLVVYKNFGPSNIHSNQTKVLSEKENVFL
jgi:hypothetical protein